MAMTVEWTRQYLETLQENAVSETQRIEFKQQAPAKAASKTPDDRARALAHREEFLKDVTGMANGGGGDILYGVTDRGALKPLQDAAPETFDQLERRLHNWIENGVEPTLHGASFDKIVVDDGYVLRLHIPTTMAGPFWVNVPSANGDPDGSYRVFKVRRGSSVIDMSYHEVREAFDRNSNALLRARGWSAQRLEIVRSMISSTVPVIHIVPLAGYQRPMAPLSIPEMREHAIKLAPLFSEMHVATNFDGARYYFQERFEPPFVQVFRDGALELADIVTTENEDYATDGGAQFLVQETRLADFVMHGLRNGLAYSRATGPASSLMVCVSLLRANASRLWPLNNNPKPADRQNLVVPPFSLEADATEDEIQRVAKDALDMLMQAYGVHRCTMFDNAGKWRGG